MDISLSPAEQAFRAEVRAFLDAELPQELRESALASPSVFVEPELGMRWQRILFEKGWLGYYWPVEHGGTGWTPLQRYIFEKECALAGAPSLPVMGLKLLAPVLWTFGDARQKEFYLPRILSGEHYWCQGFSEAGSGSDLAALKTRAVRVVDERGDRYVVNGAKLWTTHAHHANRMFALVRSDPSAKKQAGISFVLIDMSHPGVTIRPIRTIAGDHEVNEVFLENVEVPIEDLVGEPEQGWAIAKFLLENERGGSCHAPALLCQLNGLEKAAAEQPDGRGGKLAQCPSWRRKLAGLRLRAQALDMIELKIIAAIAKGSAPGPQTSLTKLLASNLHQDIDLLTVELYGPAGLQLDVARPLYGDNAPPPLGSRGAQLAAPRYLNSRAWSIFGGTNEVQAKIIAKTVLGL